MSSTPAGVSPRAFASRYVLWFLTPGSPANRHSTKPAKAMRQHMANMARTAPSPAGDISLNVLRNFFMGPS